MTTEYSVCEDDEIETRTVGVTHDTIDFPELPPHDPLTPYERRRVEESSADVEMRRQAAAAAPMGPFSVIDQYRKNKERARMPLNTGEDAPFTVPTSINEQRITSLTVDETELGFLQTGIGFLTNTRKALERVSAAYEALRADATLSPEARSLKVSTAADKAHDIAYQAQHKALETIAKQVLHVETELRTPLSSAAHTPGMAELRTVLRSMSADKRRAAIQQAIAADNPTEQQKDLINAALGGHHLMSGLDEAEYLTYTSQLNRKRSPVLVRRLEMLQKSMQAVASVNLPVLTTAFEGAQRATFRKAKSLRALSEKAQAALDAVLNPGAAS